MDDQLPQFDLRRPEDPTIQVARHLIDYMFRAGVVEPGSRLPSERKLAEAFGIGRGTVREALKSLSLLGLLEVRQGDGTYVRRPDSELLPRVIEWGLLLGERAVTDLVEARAEIEVSTATLAAQRRSDVDLADLEAIMSVMEASFDDPSAFVEADVGFHLRLAEAAGNSVLSDVLRSIQSLLRVWIGRVIGTGAAYRISCDEHQAVLKAVGDGDATAAAEAMRVHMQRASARLLETLPQHDE
ncbi:MAG: FadR/GntR family transcriptional regulator [Dehalococcoidia bacterium]